MTHPETMNTSASVFLLLGSNLGASADILQEALKRLEFGLGPIMKASSIYQTAAWGLRDQPDFLNQVIEIETSLLPRVCLDVILQIETELGRERRERYAARTLDIDILFYGSRVISEPGLSIPHPRMQDRRFVLVPLGEIAGRFSHPVLGKTVDQLLQECKDPLPVKKISEK